MREAELAEREAKVSKDEIALAHREAELRRGWDDLGDKIEALTERERLVEVAEVEAQKHAQRVADEASHIRSLQEQRAGMFEMLTSRACRAMKKLGVTELPRPTIHDDSHYLAFFTKLVERLEEAAGELDQVVVEECRELLGMGSYRIFSHLLRRQADFPLGELTAPAPRGLSIELVMKAREAASAFTELFTREDDGEQLGEDDDAS